MKTLMTIALTLAAVGCNKDNADKSGSAPVQPQRVAISVTEKGFEPADVQVPAGKPVTLVFDRMTDHTCAKQVVIKLADGSKIEKDLPLNTPVEVATTFPSAGKVSYACGMNMVTGVITVQ